MRQCDHNNYEANYGKEYLCGLEKIKKNSNMYLQMSPQVLLVAWSADENANSMEVSSKYVSMK